MEKYEAAVLVKHRAFVQLKTALQEMMPADIAQLLSELIEEQDEFGEKEFTLISVCFQRNLRRKHSPTWTATYRWC